MNTRQIYSDTPAADKVIPLQIERSAFIFIDGTDFSVKLQHLNDSITTSGNTELSQAVDADFSDIKPLVILSHNNNHTQTLGGGNYALKVLAAGAAIVVSVTE